MPEKSMEGFKKEVKEELAKKQPETGQEKQISKESDYSYITNIMTSTKIPFPPEEIKRRAAEISKILKPLMKKYQISTLTCNVIRIYE